MDWLGFVANCRQRSKTGCQFRVVRHDESLTVYSNARETCGECSAINTFWDRLSVNAPANVTPSHGNTARLPADTRLAVAIEIRLPGRPSRSRRLLGYRARSTVRRQSPEIAP